jgi:tetratricopeptide (TPR) repeat protein
MPAFLRDHPSRPRPLNPPAEACFTHALELAPDQIEPYEALFHYHRDEQEDAKAAAAAERLLKHFPDHAATLEELGDLRLRQKHYDAALGLLQRALRANPLDRKLRAKVGTAHVYRARSQVEAGRFDEARQDYQAALALNDGQDTSVILSRWAGCEFKAGATERAEELLQQVRAQADSQLLVAYTMLIEAIRLKLPRPLKTRFDAEFKAGLEAPPTGAAAAGLVNLTAALQCWDVTYRGQKTHAKKVRAYLDKARTAADFTAKQLDTVCSALLALESFRKLRQFTALGRRKFPNEPSFPYLEAVSYFQQNPDYLPMWEVRHLLEEAERLARAKPADERWKDMLDDIQKKRHALDMLNPFSSFMQSFFDNMFGEEDEFYDDEEDEDYW